MRIEYASKALSNLNLLIDFAEQLHGSEFAYELNIEIIDAIDDLVLQPRAWPVVQIESQALYRQLTIRKLTIVLYRIEGDSITIHDIRAARSDWKK